MRTQVLSWMLMAAIPPCVLAQEEAKGCPQGPSLRAPDFPVDLIRKGIAGSVVLDLTIDDCGRVLDAKVKKGDKTAFNKAALASVQGVTLNSAQRAGARDGHVDLPIDFKTGTSSYQIVDWPATHKRPRYILDETPMPYPTPEAANAGIKFVPDQIWPSPYAVRSRFVQTGEPGRREFWLFVFKDGVANLAAHYRPVMEGGLPVVRLSLLCSDTPDACAKAQKALLEGLPYAKAGKP